MEAQRSVRTEPSKQLGNAAPSSVVHLHGVPVPSRVFGFSAGWYRPDAIDPRHPRRSSRCCSVMPRNAPLP